MPDIAEHRFRPMMFTEFRPLRRHISVATFVRLQQAVISETEQMQAENKKAEAAPGGT